jgi:hypothetical protein
LIFKRLFAAFSLKRSRSAAAQFALFAMFIQALIPLTAAVSLPGSESQARDGQNLPAFYLVICTAYGAQTHDVTTDQPLDGGSNPAVMPWDCPVCQVQTNVQGPVPNTPQMALVLRSLPREDQAPIESERVAGLWTLGPGPARGPPSA